MHWKIILKKGLLWPLLSQLDHKLYFKPTAAARERGDFRTQNWHKKKGNACTQTSQLHDERVITPHMTFDLDLLYEWFSIWRCNNITDSLPVNERVRLFTAGTMCCTVTHGQMSLFSLYFQFRSVKLKKKYRTNLDERLNDSWLKPSCSLTHTVLLDMT